MDSFGFCFGCVACVEENLFLVLVLVQVADADGPPAALLVLASGFWLLVAGAGARLMARSCFGITSLRP